MLFPPSILTLRTVSGYTHISGFFLYRGAKQQTCRGIIRCLGITKSCFAAFCTKNTAFHETNVTLGD